MNIGEPIRRETYEPITLPIEQEPIPAEPEEVPVPTEVPTAVPA